MASFSSLALYLRVKARDLLSPLLSLRIFSRVKHSSLLALNDHGEDRKFYETATWCQDKKLFSLSLTKMPNKLDCLPMASFSSLA